MENIFWIVVAPIALIAIFYWPGRAILRLATKGRYPPPTKIHNIELVAIIGLAALLVILTIYYK